MAQRVCWDEAPIQTAIFAGGICEIGRLLISFCLGKSKAEFVRRLLRWWLGVPSVLADGDGNARLATWRSALRIWA